MTLGGVVIINGFTGPEFNSVAGSCEHSSELTCSIKEGETS